METTTIFRSTDHLGLYRYRRTMLWLLLGLGCCVSVHAEPTCTAVIYPEMKEPYRSVFEKIIAGIENQTGSSVWRYPLTDQPDLAALQSGLRARRCGAVITLGRRGMDLGVNLASQWPVVAGAVLLEPGPAKGAWSAISLTPAPDLFFAKLKSLAPQVKRIHVVYQAADQAGLIALAKSAAKTTGFDLLAYEAASVQASLRIYHDILDNSHQDGDAIWLIGGTSSADEALALPLVLEKSWQRQIVVFSDNPAHVKKGILFALYPDNFNLGRSLALMAQHPEPTGIAPLRDLFTAVNLRTAEHLGLVYSAKQQRSFNLVFPPL